MTMTISRVPAWIQAQSVACYVLLESVGTSDVTLDELIFEVSQALINEGALFIPIDQKSLAAYWDVSTQDPVIYGRILAAVQTVKREVAERSRGQVKLALILAGARAEENDPAFSASRVMSSYSEVARQCIAHRLDVILTEGVYAQVKHRVHAPRVGSARLSHARSASVPIYRLCAA